MSSAARVGRAQRRHVEPVVPQASLGHARVVRRLDRAAEGARVAEPGVVDQDEQDVGRPFGRRRVPDQVPIRLRAVECPVWRRPRRSLGVSEGWCDRVDSSVLLLRPVDPGRSHSKRKSSSARHSSAVRSLWESHRHGTRMPGAALDRVNRWRVMSVPGAHTCARI